MEIKWPNVVALGLVLLSVVLAMRNHRQLGVAIGSISHIGPGNTTEDKTLGLCVLGVILVSLVAVVRLVLSTSERKEK
ncbi:MAG: hypothetical protein IH989_05515 [Planctomycetes bacterium]|nr:hypothetical protein [Planctomycetota bacterium]